MSCDFLTNHGSLMEQQPKIITDTDKNLVATESVLIDDEEILGQYRETPNVDVVVDDDTEENAEKVEPPNKPSRSEIYAAIELLQKCSPAGGRGSIQYEKVS